MLSFLKRKPPAPPVKATLTGFSEIIPGYSKPIKQIKNLLISERAEELASAVIVRFLKFVWTLPASEKHHLNREFGLFEHSLEVAILQLQDFERQLVFEPSTRFDGETDALKTQQKRPLWQYAYFLFGLLHDIGKVYDVIVYSDSLSDQWAPMREYMYDFYVRKQGDINVKHIPDRVYMLHKKVPPALSMRVLSADDIEYMGRDIFGELVDGLSHYTHKSCLFYSVKNIGKNADMRATSNEVADAEKSTNMAEEEVLKAIRDTFQSGERSFNTPRGPFWVLQDHIAMNVALFYEYVTKLRNDGVKLPTENRILQFLVNRNYVEPIDKQSGMCIHNATVSSDKSGKIGRMEVKMLLFKKKVITDRQLPIYSGYFSITK